MYRCPKKLFQNGNLTRNTICCTTSIFIKEKNQQKSIYEEGSSSTESTAVETLLPQAGPLGRPIPGSRPRPFALTPVRLSPSF